MKIEMEDKDALMTPSQIGVAWLDVARVVMLPVSKREGKADARTHERGRRKEKRTR